MILRATKKDNKSWRLNQPVCKNTQSNWIIPFTQGFKLSVWGVSLVTADFKVESFSGWVSDGGGRTFYPRNLTVPPQCHPSFVRPYWWIIAG